MGSKLLIFAATLFFVLNTPLTQAAGEVIISEVAWMGTNNGGTSGADAADEWIELYNQSAYSIELAGWSLEAADGTPKIIFSSTTPPIAAGGFFLLERTDDGSLPGVVADFIYTGALSNSGEVLILKDTNGNEINRVDASSGWPAGDNSTKETMQWTGSTWITAEPTPRATNKNPPSPPPPPEPEPEPEPSNTTPETAPEPRPLSEPASASVPKPASQSITPSAPKPTPSSSKSLPAPPVVSSAAQIPEPSAASTDSTATPLGAISETLPSETSSKKFPVLWIIVIVLLILNAGLLWILRARRNSAE